MNLRPAAVYAENLLVPPPPGIILLVEWREDPREINYIPWNHTVEAIDTIGLNTFRIPGSRFWGGQDFLEQSGGHLTNIFTPPPTYQQLYRGRNKYINTNIIPQILSIETSQHEHKRVTTTLSREE